MESSSVPSTRHKIGDSHERFVILDIALALLIITPAVVTYWRVTWMLFDTYLLPEYRTLSTVTSLCIGFFGVTIFTVVQYKLKTFVNSWRNSFSYYLVTRCYTALFGLACVNSWRGIWDGMNLLTGTSLPAVFTSVFLSIGILVVMGTLRNIIAPPVATLSDHYHGYFEVPTLFRKGGRSNTGYSCLYVLDSFFSVCIIGTLVVVVWRGVWAIMDKYLYPEQEQMSAWLSLVIGYSVVLVAFSLQYWVKNLVRRIKGIKRIIVVDIYLLFSFFGAVNVWRGIWNMLDVYFLPEAQVTSYWISHIACFIILVALNSSNSILVRGVYMDGEGDGTQCVDFPCYYVRLLVQKRKRKKNNVVEKEDKEMIQVKGNLEEEEEIEQSVMGKLLTNSVIKENGDIKANKNGENIKTIVQYDNNIV
ncbi:uncharacterized protein LOC126894043 isoform X2 [Daktulosphaira vitifoliae]|uniref:uncharacterized protein LOC126894043 isoform X2 n=1 Tax=Daktulosphaira vitifoliae TaxID=58002 RepID=UPI0021A997B5|nr:uncharacterized protein LOC126894043 isoform X2 [Daktulosphaira vitifoliae]